MLMHLRLDFDLQTHKLLTLHSIYTFYMFLWQQ